MARPPLPTIGGDNRTWAHKNNAVLEDAQDTLDRVDPGAASIAAAPDGSATIYIGNEPIALKLGIWDATWSGAIAYPAGTARSSMVDSAAEWNDANAKAIELGVKLTASGHYRFDSEVNITCPDFDLGNATVHWGSWSGCAVLFGTRTSGAVVRNIRGVAPRVVNDAKTTIGWAGDCVGIEFANLLESEIEVPDVYGFDTGSWLSCYGTGHVSCDYQFNRLRTNRRNLRVAPSTGDLVGWVNQIKYTGEQFTHDSSEGLRGKATSATSTTLTDTNMANNQANGKYTGRTIKIYEGTGTGQTRTVTNFEGGSTKRFTVNTAWDVTPDSTSRYYAYSTEGMCHILIEMQTGGSPVNNHKFTGINLEGNAEEYKVVLRGASNVEFDWMRWESFGSGRPQVRLADASAASAEGSHSNVFYYGNSCESILWTVDTFSESRNDWYHRNGVTLQGVGDVGTLLLKNATSNTSPALTIIESGTSVFTGNPATDYAVTVSATEMKMKRAADAYPRVLVDFANGRIYLGNGTVAPAARLNAFGTSANLYTPGKLLALGGLGVGNSTAASALGSLARVAQVTDDTGAALGYVPIYSTFTP